MTARGPQSSATSDDPESERLRQDATREKNWTRWGPYLAERQWGTVREDYSEGGGGWKDLTHDHARSRAYRWGEDGLLGFTDRQCRICFALALWNGKDPILKERLFGLTNGEGNHGEDVKELYYYLDATPTFAYAKALYKYPQGAYPYAALVEENRRRGVEDREYEIEDTGLFADGRYFDVLIEYAKVDTDDLLIRITCTNRAREAARLELLPQLWLRNTWAWGRSSEGYWPKGNIAQGAARELAIDHPSLGKYALQWAEGAPAPQLLFTENETNFERLFGARNAAPFVKDAFHRRVVEGDLNAVNTAGKGSKAALWYSLELAPGASTVVRLRLRAESALPSGREPALGNFAAEFDAVFALRSSEADLFYARTRSAPLSPKERQVVRQADAGLLWSRQFYHYIVSQWLEGDPAQPAPPSRRREGTNHRWTQLYARDVLSMPDKWEYPWFAAWDLGFHCVAMARTDPQYAKQQLLLLCREWYMQANGQLPAYELSLGDVNPPVHAWAVWRVYQLDADRGQGKDRVFLETAFHKCLINFTWWVNREDLDGDNLFSGGFLGLDNVGLFDRSKPLPGGGQLQQADATAWMAVYCTTMFAMALELARTAPAYADIATKFFEHFMAIAQAMNQLGGTGLWDEEDGFYYDQARNGDKTLPLRVRSVVGLIPLFAVESLEAADLERLPLLQSRLDWILANKPELARSMCCLHPHAKRPQRLLAIPTPERLKRVLSRALDEAEFLSPHGVRSLSKAYAEQPFVLAFNGEPSEVRYAPSESTTKLFGGNSNWRGPIWFPVNYLLIEALKRYHHFYRDTLSVEFPTGSGKELNLLEVAQELERRLASIFDGAWHGESSYYATDPQFRDLTLFHEYFDGDTGRGLGASHQTGWTALAGNLLERVAFARARATASR
jgi:hypothetical protein